MSNKYLEKLASTRLGRETMKKWESGDIKVNNTWSGAAPLQHYMSHPKTPYDTFVKAKATARGKWDDNLVNSGPVKGAGPVKPIPGPTPPNEIRRKKTVARMDNARDVMSTNPHFATERSISRYNAHGLKVKPLDTKRQIILDHLDEALESSLKPKTVGSPPTPSALSKLKNWKVAVGAGLLAAGGIGAYAYGKKKSNEKEDNRFLQKAATILHRI